MSLEISPNHNPSTILVIGAGSIGVRHIRCFLATERAQVFVCESNAALLKQVTDQYNVSGSYIRLDDALNSDNYDAALIATPAHTHIPIAQQCADHGLHLLIEKPLSLSYRGISKLRQTLSENRRIGAVGYVHRANPVYTRLKKELDTGRWGAPLELTINTGQHFPTFRPAYRDIYYNDRSTGGGAIIDFLSHVLNLGEWLAGPVSHIFADADHLALPGITVEDTVHVTARHGRIMASYSINQHQYPNETYLKLVCTQATVRAEPIIGRITWFDSPCGEANVIQSNSPDRDAPFIAQAENFLDAVEGLGTPFCSIDEALQTQCAIEQVLKSADSPPWHVVNSHA